MQCERAFEGQFDRRLKFNTLLPVGRDKPNGTFLALFFVPLTAIILSGLPPSKIPAAAGLSNFVRVFAGAVGTSLATTGWNDRTILHHSQLVEQASVHNPTFVGAIDAIRDAELRVGSGQSLVGQDTDDQGFVRPQIANRPTASTGGRGRADGVRP